jgi:hypothetical protein
MAKKRVPIKRMSKFFGEEDFRLENTISRSYVEDDIDFRVVLYAIDYEKTNTDDLYGEVEPNQMRYRPPVELSVTLSLLPKVNKNYNTNGSLLHEEWGNLVFSVYIEQLTELGIEINKGDFVGYPVNEDYFKYFEIVDNDEVYDDTKRLLGGKRGFYRKITCVPVDQSVFNG